MSDVRIPNRQRRQAVGLLTINSDNCAGLVYLALKSKLAAKQLSSPLFKAVKSGKKSTFSEVENFAASVSLDYVPNPNVDYYITCFNV